ncbi:uncharacterized protein ACBT57_025441 isoform 3-T4 [Dama dama]
MWRRVLREQTSVYLKKRLKRWLQPVCLQHFTMKDGRSGPDTVVCPQERWRQIGQHPSGETRTPISFQRTPCLPLGQMGGAGTAQDHGCRLSLNVSREKSPLRNCSEVGPDVTAD